MKDILHKQVLYCKQLKRACKLHEINTATGAKSGCPGSSKARWKKCSL